MSLKVYTAEVAMTPKSTPAGFGLFLSDPEPESKFVENRIRIRSHFSISAIAGVCMVISESKTWVNFGWIDSCPSLNRSQILKFKNLPDLGPDLKILEQERSRSLKKWLRSILIYSRYKIEVLYYPGTRVTWCVTNCVHLLDISMHF